MAAVVQGFLSVKDAWAAAMLQTAGVMLGGWMVVYAFRRWFGGSSAKTFTYFDPNFVYQVGGETVTVTDVSDFGAVEVRHQFSSGNYQSSRVMFDLDGGKLIVPVTGAVLADMVEDYYRALVKIEDHPDKKWSELSAAEMGGVAKHVATEETMPPDATAVRLEVTDAPGEPKKARRSAPALINYVIILALGGLIYTAFWQIDEPLRDDRAFDRTDGGGAPALRGYLIDPRNTRHREEAQTKLAALYTPALSKVETGTKDPKAKEGLLAILDSLKSAEQPVVSIEVKEDETPDPYKATTSNRLTQLRTDLADAFATHLGKELIGFVRAPDGEAAHFELVYSFAEAERPAAGAFLGTSYTVIWRLKLRSDPTAAAIETEPRKLPKTYQAQGLDATGLPADLKAAIFNDLFGTPAPFISPPPPPGGDFDE